MLITILKELEVLRFCNFSSTYNKAALLAVSLIRRRAAFLQG
jgi:hypothetical protein